MMSYDEPLKYIRNFERLQERINAAREKIEAGALKLEKTDRRITIFTQLFGITDRAKMGIEYVLCSLDNATIQARMFSGLDRKDFIQRLNGFVHFIFIEANHAYFGLIEAFLRQILRALEVNPKTNFWELSDQIVCRLEIDKRWVEFLNFYAAVRNTQHNNGVFFPSDKKDRSFSYRGASYQFACGQPVHFLDGTLRLALFEDGNDFVLAVCESGKLRAIPVIDDPSHFEY